MRILLFLITAISLQAHANEVDQLSQMFSYFQATCPTQGPWTNAALSQTKSLISVLQAIQNDPDCKTLSGAVSSLDILAQKIQDLQNDKNSREVLSLKRQQQTLLMQMSSNPDATMLPIIEEQLQSNQVSLAQYVGYQDADKKVQRVDEAETLRNLVLTSNVVLTQAVANQTCLMKNPSLFSGLASVAGAVAAGAVNSGASLAIGAGVNLLGSVMDFLRQSKIAREVDHFAQNLASQSYACVLESLTNQYCGAQDAINVVKVKARSLTSPATDDEIWTGVRILDRDLPLALNWLKSVEAGVDPTNQGEGGRQNKVLVRRQLVQSARPLGLGTISEKQILFLQATTDKQRWVIMRSTISDMLNALGVSVSSSYLSQSSQTNPLLDINSYDYAPYYLLGLTLDQVPKANGSILNFSNFDPFTQWPPGMPPFKPNLDIVHDQLLAWILAAQTEVDTEFATVLQPDPLRVISDASTLIRERSPVKSLNRMIKFLSDESVKASLTGANAKIYFDTIERLNSILGEISIVLNNTSTKSHSIDLCDLKPLSGDPNLDSVRALACIYRLARLEYGTVFVQGRIERSVRVKLNDYLIHGRISDPKLSAQLLASEDVIRDIQAFSGSTNLTQINRDLEISQEVTDRNLQDFLSLFGRYIAKSLKDKMALEKKTSEPTYYKSRAEVCLLLAAAPEWPREVPRDLCSNVQIASFFAGGPSSAKLTSAVLSLPLPERSCLYRDYNRQAQIYQDYKLEKSDKGSAENLKF